MEQFKLRRMYKDHFYYILQNRLEYAKDYLNATNAYLRSINFHNKVQKEFYRDKKILFILVSLLNLPTDVLRYLRYMIGEFNCRKILKEIEVLEAELKKYEG